MRSVSGNDDDCDDDECRDQRKSAIKCFRSGLWGSFGRRHGLFRRLQFAGEPANSPGFHRIRRDGDLFEVIAFGAFERAKFKSRGPRRDPREPHARSAFRAVELLNREQWDCGWVIGHCIPLGLGGSAKLSVTGRRQLGDGDGTSMLFGFRRRRSLLLTFEKINDWPTWPANARSFAPFRLCAGDFRSTPISR